MDWQREAATWPHSEASRFVDVDGCRLHVQQMGKGPALLLLHGSGATTHSFQGLMPILATRFTVLACDLPGHGFSETLHHGRATIGNVATLIAGLTSNLGCSPVGIIGHSAGAAIGVEMVHMDAVGAGWIVSINGAFYPFPGFARDLFPALARMLFLNPFVPKLFAHAASSEERVQRLIRSTGSRLSDQQISFYQRAFRNSDHVEGTLAMMANWDLSDMQAKLAALDIPVLLVVGLRDGTVDPKAALKTQSLLKHGHLLELAGYGHLVHEEAPEEVGECIATFLDDAVQIGKTNA